MTVPKPWAKDELLLPSPQKQLIWQRWSRSSGPVKQVPGPTAPWFRRAWGFLFDLLMMALIVLVWFIPSVLIEVVFHATGWLAAAVYEVAILLTLGLLIAYPVYFIGKRGQTPGMKLLQIRLYRWDSDLDLRPPSYKTSWGRWAVVMVFNLLSGALFGIPIILDYLWASWSKEGQCLHDKAVGTVAIDERALPQPAR